MAYAIAGAAVGSVLIGGYETLHSAHQAKKDKEAADALKRPYEKVQDEYYQNRNLAENVAQQGLPQTTKNYLTDQSQTGLSTALQYLKEAGGSPNDISSLFTTYANSIGSIGAKDAEVHQKNIEYFMGANSELAGEKTKQYGVNELQPYEDKLSQLTQSQQIDKQNINEGINTAIGGATAFSTALTNSKLTNSQVGANNAKRDYYNRLFGGQAPYSLDNVKVGDIA